MKTQEQTPESNQVMHSRMVGKAENILRAIFGEIDILDYSQNWVSFRSFLIDSEKIDHMRTDKHFKWAMQLVMYVNDLLKEIHTAIDPTKSYKNLADYFLQEPSKGDTSDHIAVLKLIEAFNILKTDRERYSMHDEDIMDS
jgi:hypothetical protein